MPIIKMLQKNPDELFDEVMSMLSPPTVILVSTPEPPCKALRCVLQGLQR